MKKVCLKVGLSYTTKGFSCVNGITVDVEDDIAEKLVKTGRFAIVRDVVKDDPPAIPTVNGTGTPPANGNDGGGQNAAPPVVPDVEQLSADMINHMKKDELIALAAEKSIDISDCNNNDERAAKICGMLGLASTVNLGL